MQAKQQQFIAARWFHQAVTWVKEGSPDYIPGASDARTQERRRFKRVKMSFDLELKIGSRLIPAQGSDLHDFGAKVICDHGIVPGTMVLIHLVKKRIVGFAYVRHSTQRGNGTFAIGLEFPAPLMPKEPGPWQYSRVVRDETF